MKKIIKLLITIIFAFIGIFLTVGIYASIVRIQCSIPTSSLSSPIKNKSTKIENLRTSLDKYQRTQESTYIKFPEWYIVYSAQEYGAFLEKEKPSFFPYLSATHQYWCSYSYAYDVTRKDYPFNSEDHIVNMVIGISFSVEYIAKSVYEHTIGNLTEVFTSNPVEEETYATQVAIDYGNFLPQTPWYEFPFEQKLQELWTQVSWWGSNPIRKIERRYALSLEYGVKALYGNAIRNATKSTFQPPAEEIYLWTGTIPEELLTLEPRIRVVQTVDEKSQMIATPRYTHFNEIIPLLANKGIDIYEIGGNLEIMITVIAPKEWEYTLTEGQHLYELPILTDQTKKRVAIRVPVVQLTSILTELNNQNTTLEHIYDY